MRAATGGDARWPTTAAHRLWALLHGTVSLRMHKPGVVWPTSVQADVARTVVQALQDR